MKKGVEGESSRWFLGTGEAAEGRLVSCSFLYELRLPFLAGCVCKCREMKQQRFTRWACGLNRLIWAGEAGLMRVYEKEHKSLGCLLW